MLILFFSQVFGPNIGYSGGILSTYLVEICGENLVIIRPLRIYE